MCFLWKDPWLLWRRCRLNLAYWEINQIIVKAKECMPLNTCSPIGESLLTSLFSFLLISIRPNRSSDRIYELNGRVERAD